MKKSTVRWIVAAGLVLGSPIAACGDDSETEAGATTAAGGSGGAGTTESAGTRTGSGGGDTTTGTGGATSSTSSTASGGGGPGDLAQGCQDLAAAYCGAYEMCIPSLLEYYYGDIDSCLASYTHWCVAELDLDGIALTQAGMDGCAASLGGTSCEDLFYSISPLPGCDVFEGALGAGSPCGASNQCDTNSCVEVQDDGCGVCAQQIAPGDDCSSPTVECPDATFCSTQGVCAAYVPAGQPCTVADLCEGPNYCQTGTCSPVLEEGDPCNSQSQDPGCNIAHDLLCSAFTDTCEVFGGYGIGHAGDDCGYDLVGMTYTLCAFDAGFCDTSGDPNGYAGVCQPALAEGDACDVDAQSAGTAALCELGTTCLSGACTSSLSVCD